MSRTESICSLAEFGEEKVMEAEVILKKCIDQAEQLKRQIQSDCEVPPNCLGGEMLPTYEKVREHQLKQIKTICNQLGIL